jgi:hypothetical protein
VNDGQCDGDMERCKGSNLPMGLKRTCTMVDTPYGMGRIKKKEKGKALTTCRGSHPSLYRQRHGTKQPAGK